ncbi:hypothetical protein DMB42_38630 [Nonomuraea sp. WAC 01424]|nr:hypothetical protein DMB42_38630 [Nonomuraea sp. WAC 01424]
MAFVVAVAGAVAGTASRRAPALAASRAGMTLTIFSSLFGTENDSRNGPFSCLKVQLGRYFSL